MVRWICHCIHLSRLNVHHLTKPSIEKRERERERETNEARISLKILQERGRLCTGFFPFDWILVLLFLFVRERERKKNSKRKKSQSQSKAERNQAKAGRRSNSKLKSILCCEESLQVNTDIFDGSQLLLLLLLLSTIAVEFVFAWYFSLSMFVKQWLNSAFSVSSLLPYSWNTRKRSILLCVLLLLIPQGWIFHLLLP